MGNFSRGPKTFSKQKFGAKKSFGGGSKGRDDRDSGRPSMHDATCSSCGKDCKVPFRPTGSRPIFCSICFDKQDSGDGEKFGKKNFDRPRFGDKRKSDFDRDNAILESKNAEHLKAQFAQLHAKLDKILQALDSRPTSKMDAEDVGFEEPAEKPAFKMKAKVGGVKKSKK